MKLIKPTPSNNLVRGWGGPTNHKGIDYGWQYTRWVVSRRVLAAAPGIVVAVWGNGSYNLGWGNRIVIKHAENVYTTYNHLLTGSIAVKVGDRVQAGDFLATMGQTGDSKAGTHLHFELYLGPHNSYDNSRNNQNRVDPAPYFNKHLPGTEPVTGSPAGGKPVPAVREEVVTSKVPLRRGRTTGNTTILMLPKNAVVKTSHPMGGWRRVEYKGKVGYVDESYLIPRHMRVKAKAGLNLRLNPEPTSKILKVIPDNTRIIVTGTPGPTDSNRWRKTSYDGKTGYVSADFIEYIY